jgi:hypothetical protein
MVKRFLVTTNIIIDHIDFDNLRGDIIQAALAIQGVAICSFDNSHLILVEPNPLLML